MAERAKILLKTPRAPQPVKVEFYLADKAPARKVSVWVDGIPVADATYAKTGLYALWSAEAVKPAGESMTLEIAVDRAFSTPGDRRTLGMVLIGAGFAERETQ